MTDRDREITIKALKELLEIMLCEGDLQRASTISHTIDLIKRQKEKCVHLLKVARKMHTWIFLNTGDEQAAYDEIGLSDEDNMLLGYCGEFKIIAKEKEMEGNNRSDDFKMSAELKTAKAEAYKECIEKVKEKANKSEWVSSGVLLRTEYTIGENSLDNLLKELVGEDK